MSKKVKEIELRHRELQNEQDAREHEEREREREHELKLKEHELTQERERREHELELKRIELEMSKQGVEPGNLNVGQDRAKYVRAPQAPAFRFNSFNEKTDDLDSWFATFESQCEIFEVSDTDKRRISSVYFQENTVTLSHISRIKNTPSFVTRCYVHTTWPQMVTGVNFLD